MYNRIAVFVSLMVPVFSFIFRLPCERYGKFVKFATNSLFHGTVVERVENCSRSSCCAIRCVRHDTCSFFNYDEINESCELFDKTNGTVESKIGTTIYYTENVVMETFENSECGSTKASFRDCSSMGSSCYSLQNIAKNKRAYVSSEYGESTDAEAIDLTDNYGGYAYDCWISKSTDNYPWATVDLGIVVDVLFIELTNAPPNKPCTQSYCNWRLSHFDVTIGNNKTDISVNPLCLFNVTQDGVEIQKYSCLSGILSGRYVSVIRNTVLTDIPFVVCEVRVYSLKGSK